MLNNLVTHFREFSSILTDEFCRLTEAKFQDILWLNLVQNTVNSIKVLIANSPTPSSKPSILKPCAVFRYLIKEFTPNSLRSETRAFYAAAPDIFELLQCLTYF